LLVLYKDLSLLLYHVASNENKASSGTMN